MDDGSTRAKEGEPRRRVAAFLGAAAPARSVAAIAAALLVLAGLSWHALRGPPPADAAPAPAAPQPRPDSVVVVDVEGVVERLRDGEWEPVVEGQRLGVEDTLRTGTGAAATLALEERSRLAISDATQLSVREVAAAVQRLRLSRGRISVDHQPDGARVLVVESDRGGSVVRAGAARFSVVASGAALAVATEAGAVRLGSAGRTVEIAAGRHAVAFEGHAPSEPRPIPAELLLRVARAVRQARGACVIEGTAQPGAEVRVEGRPVEPGPEGAFAVHLPLDKGRTHARVVTRDAAGRVVERRVSCAEEASRVTDFAVRWGQDAPPAAR